MNRLAVIAIAALLVACACSKTGAKGAAVGSERGDCYGNGTCNEGLVCLSNLCVRPPPADCAKVAKQLDFLTLGNYTPLAERAAFDEQMARDCKAANLTKEEGDCILSARSRQDLGACPKPLALGDCAKMADYVMREIAPREPDEPDFRSRDGMIEQCRQRGITKAQEACVLRARSGADLGACVR